MFALIESTLSEKMIPLIAVNSNLLQSTLEKLGESARRWVNATAFRAESGSVCFIPDASGDLDSVLAGVPNSEDVYALSALPMTLPEGIYQIDSVRGCSLNPVRMALGWGLGAYQFARYRQAKRAPAQLAIQHREKLAVHSLLAAIYQVRDMINTPTEEMGPEQLADIVKNLAAANKASYRQWVGEELLAANFPTIHAVGRASHRAPRLIELTWGSDKHPQVVIIGKGVCFDSGGLDIKSADGMRWMKKDMGGAAHAIALAGLIMQANLPVYLRLLIPAVENSIAANAYRPGEVIRTRAGITVEIDNTDAEGRLILCDALAYACEQKPDFILDFATLTGAARIALGPELPVLFSNCDNVANTVFAISQNEQDPLWRLPLWQPYQKFLDSSIADIANAGASRHAGAITAALYLQRFVPDNIPWCHLDVYSWNDTDKPGRSKGGDAQSLRTLFTFLRQRYSS